MTFIPVDEVEWKSVGILRMGETRDYEYRFDLPEPLASWDVWDYWERSRFHSMRDHLQLGMTLFDVGTEQGWCNLVYASMVGPGNMVLIEPTPEFWPNIRATWEKNYPDTAPRACYDGLLSDKTDDRFFEFADWPNNSVGPLIDRNKYQYIHDNAAGIGEMKLDDMVRVSGAIPDAITMDVEGAELLVLKGAEETLRTYRPLAWVSIHPDLGERDYGVVPADVHDYMTSLGYAGTFLGEDHEQHWMFDPA